jgi:hypothetical protein
VVSIASVDKGIGYVQHYGARKDGRGGCGKICTRQSSEQGKDGQEDFVRLKSDYNLAQAMLGSALARLRLN